MIGAAEAKTLYWLPAIMGVTAAVPGADNDAASILMRCTIIGCVLGGYVGMALKQLQRRGNHPAWDRVVDGIMMWATNAAVGGVGTYVAFDHFAWQIRVSTVLSFAFMLGTIGTTVAGMLIARAKAGAKQANQRIPGAGAPQPDSDPPT